MKRKRYIIILALLLCLAVGGILCQQLFMQKNQPISSEDAEALCYSVLGEKDEATGFSFSFGVTETIEKEGKEYYVIRGSWLVNNSHMSYIGDFFVSMDGKEMYSGFVGDGEYDMEDLIWSE